jgi:Fur family transcriptional regulator, ferric uptake regulator
MALDEIIVSLRRSGYKVTPQRVAIIKTVIASNELLTPSALYEKVREADPEVGAVTVYRTLNILAELGLVCMVHTRENTHSYIARPHEHHDHLICSECGQVINFTRCNLDRLQDRLKSETGFTIQGHRLDFYGRCQECKSRADTPSVHPNSGVK